MRIMGKAAAAWCLLVSLWFTAAVAKDDKPTVSVYSHDGVPYALSYFKGTDRVIFHDGHDLGIYLSDDGGVEWHRVSEIPDEAHAYQLVLHEFDPDRAYVLTKGNAHFMTKDKGKTWTEFTTKFDTTQFRTDILHFHADDPDRVIFHAMKCLSIFCDELAVYTTDGFKTVDTLLTDTDGCWWARSSELFKTGDDKLDKNRIMCIVRDEFTGMREEQRLFITDDFFKSEFEPKLDTDRTVHGVINLAIVKRYLVVATVSENTDEMALFITDDTMTWHRALFSKDKHNHQIRQEAFTILESTDYSIQLDVMFTHPGNPMGVMFTSNSNGTYFTDNVHYTNRNEAGHVDFEKISGIQGIFLVNKVDNGEELEDSTSAEDRNVATYITFDDGRTLHEVKAGDKRLHLYSVTDIDNVGRVFSSPAPGLVMGNGNTGKTLGASDTNLYVSDDAGVTWKHARDGRHLYEFGDQGSILVAVAHRDDESVTKIAYSLNHGEDWKTVSLPDDLKIRPIILTTTQLSASLKFILVGESGGKNKIIAIDFAGLHEKTCTEDDMVDWHARVEDGEPTCVMGHKQTFRRRKKDAKCFINEPFEEPTPKSEPCACAAVDFECDYNFAMDDGKCQPAVKLAVPDGECKDSKDTFKGPSGYRKIPGNQCKDGEDLEGKKEWSCDEHGADEPHLPSGDLPENEQHVLSTGFPTIEKYYLERGDSSSTDDESILARGYKTMDGGREIAFDNQVWLTRDHGKSWDTILKDKTVIDIIPHQYFKDVVFFTVKDEDATDKVVVWYTIDRGENFHSFKPPQELASALDGHPLYFHPDRKDWLIWVGNKQETVSGKDQYVKKAYYSTTRGDQWTLLDVHGVRRCEFTGDSSYNYRSNEQFLCLAAKEEDGSKAPLRIVGGDSFKDSGNAEVLVEGVKDFALMSEFIVVAAEDGEGDGLKALTSIDGKMFERAHFPPKFDVPHQREYTVLDSSNHAINLFVATQTEEGHRYGSLVRSNSNGTMYVKSAEAVNCNELYYVDFENIPGLEGVKLINTVANREDTSKPKVLQTKITHNDGAEWAFLPPPAQDKDKKSYRCQSRRGDARCALHFHHYTEREDKKKTFSAASAVGVMFGVGNVGPNLGNIDEADTFLTTDAGLTWKNVAKGPWTWQFGDQGSLLVMVQRYTAYNKAKTKVVRYSTDEGDSWKDHEFSDKEVEVIDITSLSSGSSRNFLVWVRAGDEISAVNVDFNGLYDRPCKNPVEDPSDYTQWSPSHPLENSGCLFGHISKYWRKKKGMDCYNDHILEHQLHAETCECTRRDFECAYNFEPTADGQCSLVKDHQPLSSQEWCAQHPNETEWYGTPYRKVPLSTCVGGNQLDTRPIGLPCPGHEDEFNKKHATSGIAVLFAVVVPFAAAGAIGYYVWRNWDGKFGQIRLGESGPLDGDSPWVKYPVVAISAVVAVIAAIPLVVTSLWRSTTSMYSKVGGGGGWMRNGSAGSGRFTTRDSFARGRSDYAIVDEDEGELLGEESDEEV